MLNCAREMLVYSTKQNCDRRTDMQTDRQTTYNTLQNTQAAVKLA